METFLSNWTFIRLSGFLAYFLFTYAISAGIMSRFSLFQKNKAFLYEMHQLSGWSGLLAVIFHVALLWRDRFVPYGLPEIFVPFSSENAPLESGIGTIAFYLFLMVIASSDFLMKKLGRKLWGKIHILVIPAWILMVLHGTLIGTDSNQPWAAFIYGGGVFLVILLLIFRHWEGRLKPVAK